MSGWFITGTDTGVGKTQTAAALLQRLNADGHRACGMKPVASGCARTPAGLRSADAELLQAVGCERLPYEDVNPYAFAPAIAPHLAAAASGQTIELARIAALAQRLQTRASHLVVEGVGGWLVPLGEDVTVRDLAVLLGLPVILVVGLRLGCLNHALLTSESIVHSGLPLAGWVANQVDPHMERAEENFRALQSRLAAPCLARVPFVPQPRPAALAPYLDLAALAPALK